MNMGHAPCNTFAFNFAEYTKIFYLECIPPQSAEVDCTNLAVGHVKSNEL